MLDHNPTGAVRETTATPLRSLLPLLPEHRQQHRKFGILSTAASHLTYPFPTPFAYNPFKNVGDLSSRAFLLPRHRA